MTIRRPSSTIAVVLGMMMFATAPAFADPAAVQSVIKDQLAAFREGDADAAFSFAAPQIKNMFRTPEVFVGMVRRGYKAVYDANEPVFLRGREIEGGRYAQEVGLVDDGGKAWTALYTLERQDDGAWRITGCYLREADGATL